MLIADELYREVVLEQQQSQLQSPTAPRPAALPPKVLALAHSAAAVLARVVAAVRAGEKCDNAAAAMPAMVLDIVAACCSARSPAACPPTVFAQALALLVGALLSGVAPAQNSNSSSAAAAAAVAAAKLVRRSGSGATAVSGSSAAGATSAGADSCRCECGLCPPDSGVAAAAAAAAAFADLAIKCRACGGGGDRVRRFIDDALAALPTDVADATIAAAIASTTAGPTQSPNAAAAMSPLSSSTTTTTSDARELLHLGDGSAERLRALLAAALVLVRERCENDDARGNEPSSDALAAAFGIATEALAAAKQQLLQVVRPCDGEPLVAPALYATVVRLLANARERPDEPAENFVTLLAQAA